MVKDWKSYRSLVSAGLTTHNKDGGGDTVFDVKLWAWYYRLKCAAADRKRLKQYLDEILTQLGREMSLVRNATGEFSDQEGIQRLPHEMRPTREHYGYPFYYVHIEVRKKDLYYDEEWARRSVGGEEYTHKRSECI